MTKTEAKHHLRKAFAALTPTQRERLRWHAEEGTPICCGKDAYLYVRADGAG